MSIHFVTTRRVEFCETDVAGIVHFSNYYRYMEQAEHEFFRSLDLGIITNRPDGTVIGWPRVSAQLRFESPARYEDVLEIRLNIARQGVKSLTYNVEFWRDDVRIASGTMKTVCCFCREPGSLESIEIPPEFAEKLQAAAQ